MAKFFCLKFNVMNWMEYFGNSLSLWFTTEAFITVILLKKVLICRGGNSEEGIKRRSKAQRGAIGKIEYCQG